MFISLSRPILPAASSAILIGGLAFWFHEHYVLGTSYRPAITIGEAYKGQKLPSNIQSVINYRYIIGTLFATDAFSAAYFWSKDDMEMEGGILGFCFLLPTALNYIFILTRFITPLLILGLLIRAFILYKRNSKILYRAYFLCLIFNCISFVIMCVNLNEAFCYA